MSKADNEETKRQFNMMEDAIRPLLAGHEPGLQGAVLADLVALWVAAHAPPLREEMLDGLITLIRSLISVNDQMMFGPKGHPYNEGEDEDEGGTTAE